MKKKLIKEFKQDINQGIKGLQISALVIILLTSILSFYLTFNQGLSKTIELISRIPQNQTDFSALLAGVIMFIAIPFTLSIRIQSKES